MTTSQDPKPNMPNDYLFETLNYAGATSYDM